MTKKLIYENKVAIEARKRYADELVNSLNHVLKCFESEHNHFSQPIDENFAFQFVTQPVETFDELLRVNSPIKPIGGKKIDIEKLAELCGINRNSFIGSCIITLPGSKDQYNRSGRQGLLKLTDKDKHLIKWGNDSFVLDEQALAVELEFYKVYATEPEQFAEVQFWEDLCSKLNVLIDRKIIDIMDANMIRQKIWQYVEVKNNRFMPKYDELAKRIKAMVPVN